jgi:hypothetical protein
LTPRKRRQRLDSIQQIAEQLRQSADVPAPDLTSSILNRVDATRPFLDGRTRRMLWVGRIALGVSVATVGLGIALTHRWAPDTVDLVSSRPAPLSNVVETVRTEAGVRLVEFRVAVDSASQPDAASGSAAQSPSGGLLALVTSAAPTPASASSKPCTICGPMIPPSEAARRVPAATLTAAIETSPVAPSTTEVPAPRITWLTARVRLGGSGGLGAGGTGGIGLASAANVGSATDRTTRLVLDELAPLGVGPSADSALAPK